MPKIDTSKIPNYADMSPEQKVAALEAYEVEETGNSSEVAKLKQAVTKARAETEEAKRQLRSKQTDEEVAAAERDAQYKELQEKYDTLAKNETIRGYAEKYRKMGYDEALAKDTAEAIVAGDMDRVLANGEKYRASYEQNIRADITRSTPKPTNGNEGTVYKSKADIMKIQDAAERQQAIAENMELFSSKE